MKKTLSFTVAALLAAGLGANALAMADDTYPILIERPVKVGLKQQRDMKVIVESISKTEVPDVASSSKIPAGLSPMAQDLVKQKLGGVGERDNKTTYVFKAEETVEAVNAAGQPTKTLFKVEEFSETKSGVKGGADTSVALMQPGQAFLKIDDAPAATAPSPDAHHNHSGVRFEGADKSDLKLSDAAIGALRIILGHNANSSQHLDDIFGSSTPRKPGDKWAIDPSKFLSLYGVTYDGIASQNVSGETTFVKVGQEHGVNCTVLEFNVAIKNVKPAVAVPNLQVTKSEIVIDIVSSLPVDTTLPAVSEISKNNTVVEGTTSVKGKSVPTTIEHATTSEINFGPAKSK